MVVLTEVELLKTHILPTRRISCALCGKRVVATKVTPGSQRADGRIAFACTIHLLRQHRRWILFWAAFDETERRRVCQGEHR